MKTTADDFQFNAQWITIGKPQPGSDYFFRAVKNFSLESIPDTAPLAISADTQYCLWVNSKRIDRGPARGTRELQYYDVHDVAKYLKEGMNTIAVLVQYLNPGNFISSPNAPGMLVEIPGIVSSDESWSVKAAEDFRTDTEYFTLQTTKAEWRNFEKTPEGWRSGQGIEAWDKATIISPDAILKNKKLVLRDVPPLKKSLHRPKVIATTPKKTPAPSSYDDVRIANLQSTEKHLPLADGIVENGETLFQEDGVCTINPQADGSGVALILDFQKEIVGRLAIEVEAEAGTIIDVGYEECLVNDRIITDLPNELYNLCDRYILKDGRQTAGSDIIDRGWSMVQLNFRNVTSPIRIHSVQATDERYPYKARGEFNCSDSTLNKIWEMSAETLSVCTTDVFTDCPWRERSFWVNDLVVENKTTLVMFGASEVHRRAFRLAFGQSFENGFIPGVCPAPEETFKEDAEKHLVLFPTNFLIVLTLKDYWMYTGDMETVKKYLPGIQKILDTMSGYVDDRGVMCPPKKYWNFLDWSFHMNDLETEGCSGASLNALYGMALDEFLNMAHAAAFDVDEDIYTERRDKAFNGISSCLVDGQSGYAFDEVLVDGNKKQIQAQLANALAFLFAEGQDTAVTENFAKALVDEKQLMPELYLHYFVFHAMQKTGQEAAALERIRRIWGPLTQNGSTTLHEAGVHQFAKKAFDSGSLCHGFSTAPVEFFQTSILGVRPLKAGFKEFSVNPIFFDLEFASGKVPTPHGEISVEWNNTGELTLEVPAGCTAKLPDGTSLEAGRHSCKLQSGEKEELMTTA